MTKIFATGVTGYLGGDAAYAILQAHPEYEISCLVRDKEKGALVSAAHPSVRIVHGSLDDSDLLEEEAANADVVCNFAHATHEPAVQALARGLLPGRIRSAVVSTGSAYGRGRGAVVPYRRTAVHELARAALARGRAFVVGEGASAWTNVHVRDLSDLYLRLVEHAAAGGGGGGADGEGGNGLAVWGGPGEEGFYFAEGGEHVWRELARSVAAEAAAQGFVARAEEPEAIDPAQAAEIMPMGQFFWGCNARVEGRRARRALNWAPRHPSLREEIKAIVATEAKELGLV
ncbi:hypothetical protein VTH06DRAFT_2142 [Thermothelomyces fergusii]